MSQLRASHLHGSKASVAVIHTSRTLLASWKDVPCQRLSYGQDNASAKRCRVKGVDLRVDWNTGLMTLRREVLAVGRRANGKRYPNAMFSTFVTDPSVN